MIEFLQGLIEEVWAQESTINIGAREYTVHRMSYGQYFLEPADYKGGELDGFAPDTKWLRKTDVGYRVVDDEDYMNQGIMEDL